MRVPRAVSVLVVATVSSADPYLRSSLIPSFLLHLTRDRMTEDRTEFPTSGPTDDREIVKAGASRAHGNSNETEQKRYAHLTSRYFEARLFRARVSPTAFLVSAGHRGRFVEVKKNWICKGAVNKLGCIEMQLDFMSFLDERRIPSYRMSTKHTADGKEQSA